MPRHVARQRSPCWLPTPASLTITRLVTCSSLARGTAPRPGLRRKGANGVNGVGTSLGSAAGPRPAQPLVRCEDLTVRFVSGKDTVHAVNGVDFTLDAGEVLCIVGESGAGKSVMLRAMM